MNLTLKVSLVTAALALVTGLGSPSNAADLGGSIKDGRGYYPPPMASVGPCYFRGDVGYSWTRNPDVKWTVTDPATGNFVTDDVTGVSMGNGWTGEAGIGCGSGSRGLRGELMLGYRGSREIEGIPGPWNPGPTVDPLHTSLKSYTAMLNAYYDLGKWGNVVPYVGAGIGASYNMVDEVYFTGNPALTNRIEGKNELSLAWSLMAGIGYQISDRAVLDIGYRYIDLGSASSGRVDNAGFVNPPVRIDDLGAHEIKVGLRWHFGSGSCCDHAAMK